MTKATITRIFWRRAAVIAGSVLAIAAIWIAIANDVFVLNGAEIVGIRGSALAWSMLVLGLVGGLAIMAGMIAGLVAWIGALLNTAQLERKTWFLGLLLLGIFNLGVLAMLAYLIAGPDGTHAPRVAGSQVSAGAPA